MEQENKQENRFEETMIEGRNAVLEAFRSGKTVDKLFVLDGCQDGPVKTITREAKKQNTIIHYVAKERLDQLSETGKHQGVIAQAAAYRYAEVEDMLKLAEEKGEPPFLFILDGIEDPHNLGAIIRTANLAGAHGVIIPKHRAAGLTATVAKTSAGALNYTPVAKVTNLVKTMEELKEKGISLRMITGAEVDRAQIIQRSLEWLEKYYQKFEETSDMSGLMEEYNQMLVNRGSEVCVLDPCGEYRGKALGINDAGELLVEKEDGTTENVYAGEVSVRGVYGYV